MEEAERPDEASYSSLGEFFTRRLRPGARPVSPHGEGVSPADGVVTCAGAFLPESGGGFLQQVKGVHYSLNYFLGLSASAAVAADGTRRGVHSAAAASPLLTHTDGSTALFQWVVYLAPGDYHRFHSPVQWVVHKRR